MSHRREENAAAPSFRSPDTKAGPRAVAARNLLWACCLVLGSLTFAPQVASAQGGTIVALGDSNTAGYGVTPDEAFPARLEAMLRARGQLVRVINAGVPGDTLEGMLNRLDRSVPPGTRLVIIQGGYNDLRNQIPPDVSAASLEAILARLRARNVKAVLCGFFDQNWDAIGRKLAARYGATFVPGNTCYEPSRADFDGLHMLAPGHAIVATRLAGVVHPGPEHTPR